MSKEERSDEISINALLKYIEQLEESNKKNKDFTPELIIMFIRIKLLECKLCMINKNLEVQEEKGLK